MIAFICRGLDQLAVCSAALADLGAQQMLTTSLQGERERYQCQASSSQSSSAGAAYASSDAVQARLFNQTASAAGNRSGVLWRRLRCLVEPLKLAVENEGLDARKRSLRVRVDKLQS